jgi:hypothetical protein
MYWAVRTTFCIGLWSDAELLPNQEAKEIIKDLSQPRHGLLSMVQLYNVLRI